MYCLQHYGGCLSLWAFHKRSNPLASLYTHLKWIGHLWNPGNKKLNILHARPSFVHLCTLLGHLYFLPCLWSNGQNCLLCMQARSSAMTYIYHKLYICFVQLNIYLIFVMAYLAFITGHFCQRTVALDCTSFMDGKRSSVMTTVCCSAGDQYPRLKMTFTDGHLWSAHNLNRGEQKDIFVWQKTRENTNIDIRWHQQMVLKR